MGRSAGQSVRIESKARTAARPHLGISPQALQGLKILSLPVARLDTYVAGLVEQNPLLDFDYDRSFLQFEPFPDPGKTDSSSGFDAVPSWRRSSMGKKGEVDFSRIADACQETETLQSFVRTQVSLPRLSSKEAILLDSIIENLDDDGYFSGNMPALCAEVDLGLESGERLLKAIQESCVPRGIGARTLSECLLLQIPASASHATALRSIVRSGLADLAANRVTKLTRTYHVSLDELGEIRNFISDLNPRPGSSFSRKRETTYVIPDISIVAEGRGFSVRVAGELGETLVMNEEYLAMAEDRSLDGDVRSWIDAKRAEAQAMIFDIGQRRKTLHRFGLYLVEAQYDFFRNGKSHMRPLTMQQAADALGVHASTISRTVQDKYALTPWGIYPLKGFFTSSVACVTEDGGRMVSSLAIKERIAEIIGGEDSRDPLSDSVVAARLKSEGMEISRRTVAKYREAIGIGSRSQRRR